MIVVSSPVFPSEDQEKVVKAVKNIFPTAVLDVREGTIEGEADMENFMLLIRRQKILDTARSVMLRGRKGNRTEFHLNKQAAFAGKISFTEERTVLGTIKVTAEEDEMETFIDKVAPSTVNGEEVRI